MTFAACHVTTGRLQDGDIRSASHRRKRGECEAGGIDLTDGKGTGKEAWILAEIMHHLDGQTLPALARQQPEGGC